MPRLGVLTLALLACAAIGPGLAPAQTDWDDCHVSTKLGSRPGELLFRVHCDFEVTGVFAQPDAPAVVRHVGRRPRLKHGDAEDHFRCHRQDNSASCSGTMGSEVTLIGSLTMSGDRCATGTNIGVLGGPECDSESKDVSCPAIGYAAKLRDPHPSGCG